MPLSIIRQDLLKMKVDAIINPTDSLHSNSGSIDLLLKHQHTPLPQTLKLSQAYLTKSLHPNFKYIIHTVGPIWNNGLNNEADDLKSCYENCLSLALQNNIHTLAFPLISSGTFKFPKELAFTIAKNTILDFLKYNEINIYLVVYDLESFKISLKYYQNVYDYLNHCLNIEYNLSKNIKFEKRDESFQEYLLYLIDQKGISDVDCYKGANMSRKLFSKIRSNKDYQPSKQTAVALAISLKLDLEKTQELLEKAGYVLNRSNTFDLIIRYFINEEIYDIYAINETLFAFDQKLLCRF